jgi:hypothetical protein
MNSVLDLPYGDSGNFIGDGNADDFTAGFLKFQNLFDRGPDIARIRTGHGLNHDRRIAADLNTPQNNWSCFFPLGNRIQEKTLSV